MWEVNKTYYNPSLCTLLHLILPRAFKKSELTSEKWQERSLKRQKYRTCSGKTRENFQSFPTYYPSRATKLWSQELLGFQKCRYIPWERNCVQRRYSIKVVSLEHALRKTTETGKGISFWVLEHVMIILWIKIQIDFYRWMASEETLTTKIGN